jgi:hypothetical protein
VIAKPPSR